MGDFNINIIESDNAPNVSTFLDFTSSYSLVPNIVLPTRITCTTHTIIDNIFSSLDLANATSGNLLTSFSDHLAKAKSEMHQTWLGKIWCWQISISYTIN